ncbi:MAG TPA: hemerythrin domain-containing protein [Steroidobacteraceae bacterium]|nr:hemerythrin domain-containing protein [Steroidobacteraceae bacterium]
MKSIHKGTPRRAARALPTKGAPAEVADILDTLKREHEEVKSLLADLQDAGPAGERRQLVRNIKAALVPHTKAEEKVVYDAVIATSEDEAQADGYEGYLEHEWAAKTLERLEAADPDSAEHKAAAKVLKDLVEHHIEEEEENIWRDVREHFDEEERVRMNAQFEAAKQQLAPS